MLHRLHIESRGGSNMPNPKGATVSRLSLSLGPLLTLVHCLGLACSAFVLAWAIALRGGLAFSGDNKDLIFNVHPVLMLVGYIVVASEAILAYKTFPGSKAYKKKAHLVLQALALMSAILGIWAAFKFHNEKGISNLYSLHSWLGLGSVIMFGFQWIVGYLVYWSPGGAAKTRTGLLPWHVFFGLFIFSLSLVAAESGFQEKLIFLISSNQIGKFSMEAMFVNALGLLVALYGSLVILATVVSSREGTSRPLD